jgi:hypothetical protein
MPRSLERINQYCTIEQEPKPTEEGKPPAYWPSSGTLEVEHLVARYSPVSRFIVQPDAFLMSYTGWPGGPPKHDVQHSLR